MSLSIFWNQTTTKIHKTVSAIEVERKPHQGMLAEMLFSRLFFLFNWIWNLPVSNKSHWKRVCKDIPTK